MTTYQNVFIEALVIGIITGIIGLIISTIIMFYSSKSFSLQRYKFWPQILFSYMLTGIIIHILFEYTNMNKKFCCQLNRYNCIE